MSGNLLMLHIIQGGMRAAESTDFSMGFSQALRLWRCLVELRRSATRFHGDKMSHWRQLGAMPVMRTISAQLNREKLESTLRRMRVCRREGSVGVHQ